MSTYLISYDLNKHKDYPALYEAIKAISKNWCHPLDSTWFVVTELSASQIRDRILKAIDLDDDLIVSRMDLSDCAWHLHDEGVSRWLKS